MHSSTPPSNGSNKYLEPRNNISPSPRGYVPPSASFADIEVNLDYNEERRDRETYTDETDSQKSDTCTCDSEASSYKEYCFQFDDDDDCMDSSSNHSETNGCTYYENECLYENKLQEMQSSPCPVSKGYIKPLKATIKKNM
jgi:hypothetical protein